VSSASVELLGKNDSHKYESNVGVLNGYIGIGGGLVGPANEGGGKPLPLPPYAGSGGPPGVAPYGGRIPPIGGGRIPGIVPCSGDGLYGGAP
jgi:hypothetical protein